MGTEFISSGTLKLIQIYMSCSLHRGTQSYCGWCHGGCCGGRMYCPKAGYLEKIKAITSRLLGSRRERKIGIFEEIDIK